MKIYYIASETLDTQSKAERWNSYDKRLILKKCWLSFITNLNLDDSVEVFYNNIKQETIDWMASSCNHLINFNKSDCIEENFSSLYTKLEKDLECEENKNSLYGIVEDDFLWVPGALTSIKETFTLWDNFVVPNDTMINFRKPMFSKVLLGTDRYWKTSNVVSWTLFSKKHKLEQHKETVKQAILSNSLEQYNKLTQEDYCINPMPAYAAHLRQNDLSPYVDWTELWEKIKI